MRSRPAGSEVDDLVLFKRLIPDCLVIYARHVHRNQVIGLCIGIRGAMAGVIEEAERTWSRAPKLCRYRFKATSMVR